MEGGGKEVGERALRAPIDSPSHPTAMLLAKTNEIMLEKTGVHRGFEVFITFPL